MPQPPLTVFGHHNDDFTRAILDRFPQLTKDQAEEAARRVKKKLSRKRDITEYCHYVSPNVMEISHKLIADAISEILSA